MKVATVILLVAIVLASAVERAAAAPVETKKTWYLDCYFNKFVVYPGAITQQWEQTPTYSQLDQPTNALMRVVEKVRSDTNNQSLVILLRPGSVMLSRSIRSLVGFQYKNVFLDVLDTDELIKPGKLKLSHPEGRNTHLYFECCNNQIFHVDYSALHSQSKKLRDEMEQRFKNKYKEMLKALEAVVITNEYYTVNTSRLPVHLTELSRILGVRGEDCLALHRPASRFRSVLSKFVPKDASTVFLIRDDSFKVFRMARDVAESLGFQTGFELLARNEKLRFGEPGLGLPSY